MRLRSPAPLLGAVLLVVLVETTATTQPANALLGTSEEPTVALFSPSSRFLVGGATANGTWIGTDATASRLPSSAKLVALRLGSTSTLGTQPLASTHPPDICSWNWDYGDFGEKDAPLVVVDPKKALLPRPVTSLASTDAVSRTIVRNFLRAKKMPKAKVRVTGAAKADLDGDGRTEHIIAASAFQATADYQGQTMRGDYDLVLIRTVRAGKAFNYVLSFDAFRASNGVASGGSQHKLLAIADLNGDAAMEVITEATYWEASAVEVFATAKRADGPWKSVLSENCGV